MAREEQDEEEEEKEEEKDASGLICGGSRFLFISRHRESKILRRVRREVKKGTRFPLLVLLLLRPPSLSLCFLPFLLLSLFLPLRSFFRDAVPAPRGYLRKLVNDSLVFAELFSACLPARQAAPGLRV